MKTFLLGACCLLLSIYIKTSCCDTKVSHVIRSKRSANGNLFSEKFNVVVNEQGSQFSEKVTFDMKKKTATYHVPAHGDLSESDFLFDFNSNVTVIRVRGNGVCYIRSRSPDEPTLDELRKGMNMASKRNYTIRSGSRLLSTEWMPKRELDSSKLNENIAEFCRGLRIYELEEMEEDGVTGVHRNEGIARAKRSSLGFQLCERSSFYNLKQCKSGNWYTRCQYYSSHSCVYWVTCPGGIYGYRDRGSCSANHQVFNTKCCNLFCSS